MIVKWQCPKCKHVCETDYSEESLGSGRGTRPRPLDKQRSLAQRDDTYLRGQHKTECDGRLVRTER